MHNVPKDSLLIWFILNVLNIQNNLPGSIRQCENVAFSVQQNGLINLIPDHAPHVDCICWLALGAWGVWRHLKPPTLAWMACGSDTGGDIVSVILFNRNARTLPPDPIAYVGHRYSGNSLLRPGAGKSRYWSSIIMRNWVRLSESCSRRTRLCLCVGLGGVTLHYLAYRALHAAHIYNIVRYSGSIAK